MSKQGHVVIEPSQFLDRGVRHFHIDAEVGIGPCDAAAVAGAIQSVSGHENPRCSVEHRDVAERVSRGFDDVQAEDRLTVTDGSSLGRGVDCSEVSGAGIPGCAVGLLEHGSEASLMVGVMMRHDHMPDRIPAEPDLSEGAFDGPGAATDARVDEGGLPVPVENVGGDESQIDPVKVGP